MITLKKEKQMNKLLIIGASGHGKVIADIALATKKYREMNKRLNPIETISVVLVVNFTVYFLYLLSTILLLKEETTNLKIKNNTSFEIIIAISLGVMWNFPNIIKIGIF